jgi:hypothetical protein
MADEFECISRSRCERLKGGGGGGGISHELCADSRSATEPMALQRCHEPPPHGAHLSLSFASYASLMLHSSSASTAS